MPLYRIAASDASMKEETKKIQQWMSQNNGCRMHREKCKRFDHSEKVFQRVRDKVVNFFKKCSSYSLAESEAFKNTICSRNSLLGTNPSISATSYNGEGSTDIPTVSQNIIISSCSLSHLTRHDNLPGNYCNICSYQARTP